MYALVISRDFVAQHYLVGGDWGEENRNHSHHYKVELQLEREKLDRSRYLVDIVDLETKLDAQVCNYTDRTLNDLPEFSGVNPSIERFALVMCETLAARINAPSVCVITVKIWENDNAWASHTRVTESCNDCCRCRGPCSYVNKMRVGLVIYGSLDTLSGGYLYDRTLVARLRRRR